MIRRIIASACLALPFTACGGTGEEPPALAMDGQEIINGTEIIQGSLEGWGVVRVSSTEGSCTGTLLANRYVLTARHCVRAVASRNPITWGALATGIGVFHERPGSTRSITVSSVIEGNAQDLLGDHALLVLTAPIVMNDSPHSFYRRVYPLADATLLDQELFCAGYGLNTLATPGQRAAGAGTLRTAFLHFSELSDSLLKMEPNELGQIIAGGDSGGGCFLNGFALGVSVACSATPLNAEWQDVTKIANCKFIAPSVYGSFVNTNLLTTVVVQPFVFSPALPAGTVVNASVTTLPGTNATVSTASTTTLSAVAVRSGWVDAVVLTEPDGMACSRTLEAAPLSGTMTIHGGCIGDGVASTVVGSALL
jgi:hypothetical protein